MVSQALEINEDIIRVIQENCFQNDATKNQELAEDINEEEYEQALKEAEKNEEGQRNEITKDTRIEQPNDPFIPTMMGMQTDSHNMMNPISQLDPQF